MGRPSLTARKLAKHPLAAPQRGASIALHYVLSFASAQLVH
jgi:hypothetical protein